MSPCLPARPLSWLSTLRDSFRSVPTIWSPPEWITALCLSLHAFCSDSLASSDSLPPKTISVPRPAMLVEIVTAPGAPAFATISASRSCCFALRTSCLILCFVSKTDTSSELSMLLVPTRTGWFLAWHSWISLTTFFWNKTCALRPEIKCWSKIILLAS